MAKLIEWFVEGEHEKQRPLSDCSGHPFHKTQFVCGSKGQRDLELLGKILVHVSLQREAKVRMLIKEDAQL